MYINLAKNVISSVLETPKINPIGCLTVHPQAQVDFLRFSPLLSRLTKNILFSGRSKTSLNLHIGRKTNPVLIQLNTILKQPIYNKIKSKNC